MAGKLEKSKTELVAVVVVVVVLPCTECRDTGAGALHGRGHPDVLVVLLLGLLLLELGGEGEGVLWANLLANYLANLLANLLTNLSATKKSSTSSSQTSLG